MGQDETIINDDVSIDSLSNQELLDYYLKN